MSEDIAKRTQQFVENRDRIKALEAKFDKDMEPLREIHDKLTHIIQTFMQDNGLQNLKTPNGATCYVKTRRTASLSDPDSFMRFVIDNQAFDLLDRRASSTAIQEFVKKHKALPPGCNLSTVSGIGVRRGGPAAEE